MTATTPNPTATARPDGIDDLIDRFVAQQGQPATLLHDRRGTRLYRIGQTALKVTDDLMAGREAEIMRLLGHPAYREHGWDGARSWLSLRWLAAPDLTNALTPFRAADRGVSEAGLLAATAAAAGALADLHARGWRHGDLQPEHILLNGPSAVLIDLACGQGPEDVPFYVHRGGRGETTAPEIADLVLHRDDHIALTPHADVWSLGASLWWAWTGVTPIDYTDPAGPRLGLLADNLAHRLRDLTRVRPWHCPQFEEILMACLAADPADRPTAAQIRS